MIANNELTAIPVDKSHYPIKIYWSCCFSEHLLWLWVSATDLLRENQRSWSLIGSCSISFSMNSSVLSIMLVKSRRLESIMMLFLLWGTTSSSLHTEPDLNKCNTFNTWLKTSEKLKKKKTTFPIFLCQKTLRKTFVRRSSLPYW